jgi:hypothetical protein
MASLIRFSFYTNAMMTFGYIYYVECAIKLLGLGIGDYFAVHWVPLIASDCDLLSELGLGIGDYFVARHPLPIRTRSHSNCFRLHLIASNCL